MENYSGQYRNKARGQAAECNNYVSEREGESELDRDRDQATLAGDRD